MNRSSSGRLCVAAAVAASGALAVPASAAAPVITMSGSTSVAPLAGKLAKGYLKDRRLSGKLRFKLAQGGSDIGVADAAAGRVSIGNASRDPKATDRGVVFNKVARDGLCVVTHPSNPLAGLTRDQLIAIFSGRVRNWDDVPGAKARGPINIMVRTPASGTQDAFQNIFMGTAAVSSTAAAKASNGLVQQAVQSDRNAIGYVSLQFTRGTRAIPYQGVACTLANAKSGQYGGTRFFYMVTRGKPQGETRKFISWIQRSAAARRIVSSEWVPLR